MLGTWTMCAQIGRAEANTLPYGKQTEGVPNDFGTVEKDVVTIVGGDEAKSLTGKLSNDASGHKESVR